MLHRWAAAEDGAALRNAERRKRQRYPELINSPFGRLVTLGCEVGGRWNSDALRLVADLAKQKARNAPLLLRQPARAAWHSRWWGFLSVAAQASLAATLSGAGHLALGGPAGTDMVPLADLLENSPEAPAASRLPLR